MCARSSPSIERTSASCTSNGRLVEMPFGIELVGRPGLRAPGRSGARPCPRSGGSCLRSTGSSAGRHPSMTPVVHRAAVETAADDVVGARIGVGDPAGHLPRMLFRLSRGRRTPAPDRDRPAAPRSGRKSMVRPSMRGGVPVFSRPCGSFSSLSRAASEIDGGSPARPAGWFGSPHGPVRSGRCRRSGPRHALRKRRPSWVTAPATRSPSRMRSSTACWKSQRFGWFSRRVRMACRYRTRSACARVARTAGPLLEFRMRNWMPASSVAAAIAPPSASISLTRWPLPIPPIDGLQDICPRVSMLWVSSSVRAPIRAAASAASVPA